MCIKIIDHLDTTNSFFSLSDIYIRMRQLASATVCIPNPPINLRLVVFIETIQFWCRIEI